MSRFSGGVTPKIVYSGNTPNFDHPIKSKVRSSSKHCENKNRDRNLWLDNGTIDLCDRFLATKIEIHTG